MYKSLYLPYQELEKSEKLPHYIKFMGNHPKAQETAEWADDNLVHRNLAEFAMRHAKTSPDGLNDEHKTTIKHFNDSLHMPEVQKAAGMLTSKHDFTSGIQLLEDAEGAYKKRHAEQAPKLAPMEGEKVLDFGDGVAVYNLPLDENGKNENEATAMGHCATPHSGGQLWSIRRDHGNGMVEPLVSISHEDGYIGEMKGKHNWKPSTKHHGHISKLLASDIIKGFVGGGYAPESNFEFSDLNESLKKKLLDYKSELTQKVYRENLPKGFQGNYSHTPEIKSVFNSNDAEVQKKFLEGHEFGSDVHWEAAENPNIHPDVLRWLIQNHGVDSGVHWNAAANPNIHPEDLRWLIQKHEVDSDVHRTAAVNPNIHPEDLRWLIQKHKFGSIVHSNAAENPNIHPEDLRELIEKNEVGSDVHRSAATNPNIHPDVLRWLIQKHGVGSDVHRTAAVKRNIHPEDLRWLIQNHGADSDVHWFAARNPNIHPEDLRWLIEKNEVGSMVHWNAAVNPNIHPEDLRELIEKNEVGSAVHRRAAENPQFKNLPPEIQQIVKPPRLRLLQKENIQKLISIMNDENNPQLARQAYEEIRERRKEKYDRILSPEGNIEDIQHLAESHDEEISERAREELKRRGLRKSYRPLNKSLKNKLQKMHSLLKSRSVPGYEGRKFITDADAENHLLQYINKLDPSFGKSYKGNKMSVYHLKKMHKMCKALSVDDAVAEIKGPAKVNEVIPKVSSDDRAEVFNQLRMQKATEASLQKQAMPAPGAAAGMEMNPATVQTSAQTAMVKAEGDKPADSKKELQGFFRQLKNTGDSKMYAKEALTQARSLISQADLEQDPEKEKKLRAEAKKYFKAADKHFAAHIKENISPTTSMDITQMEEVSSPRKMHQDVGVRQDFNRKMKDLQDEYMEIVRPRTPEGIKAGQDISQFQARQARKAELLRQLGSERRKFDEAIEDRDIDYSAETYGPDAENMRARLNEARDPIPEEFLTNREKQYTGRGETQEQPIGRNISSSNPRFTVGGRKDYLTGPGMAPDERKTKYGPRPEVQAEHQEWLEARAGSLGAYDQKRKQKQRKQSEGQPDLSEDQAQRAAEGIVSEQKMNPNIVRKPKRRSSRDAGLSGPMVSGGAAEYLSRLAEEKARREAALSEKNAQPQKQEFASANEALALPSKQERDRKKFETELAALESEEAAKSIQKSAAHAKNPAFPKRPAQGAVSGVIPESDIVGDYSERMGEEKSVNDKPYKKQGFGSAEILKKAHALIKKK